MESRWGWIVLICVVVMAIGQILFKQVAINYNKLGVISHISVAGLLFLAGVLYLCSTGLWVWALRFIEISKAYPYFAVGFILVPLLGAIFFGEALNMRYGIGVLLIMTGVVLTNTA